MPALLDLTGEKYNRLTVICRAPHNGKFTQWRCRCDCGREVDVITMHIRSGHTKSCGSGCIPRRNSDRIVNSAGKLVRPDGYWSWKAMQSRCYCKSDDNYKKYGARGITVCDRWRGAYGLAQFLKDMGPKPSPNHSVGRKDWKLGYFPDNCRWETALQQGERKKNSNMITHEGKTQHISAWTRELGLKPGSLRLRLSRGWSVHKALSTPRLGRAPAPAGMKPAKAGCVNQGVGNTPEDELTG
jgi:hypothetical protein